jgi:hypothetical protein
MNFHKIYIYIYINVHYNENLIQFILWIILLFYLPYFNFKILINTKNFTKFDHKS